MIWYILFILNVFKYVITLEMLQRMSFPKTFAGRHSDEVIIIVVVVVVIVVIVVVIIIVIIVDNV